MDRSLPCLPSVDDDGMKERRKRINDLINIIYVCISENESSGSVAW